MKKTGSGQKVLLYTVFVGYIIILLDILFLGRLIRYAQMGLEPAIESVNLIPFKSILEELSSGRLSLVGNMLGNIVLFIPLGIYLFLFMKRGRVWSGILIVFGTSLAVEIIQYATRTGSADIDDVILNCLGGLLGILIYKALAAGKAKVKVRKLVTVISACIGIPVILIYIVLLVVNW